MQRDRQIVVVHPPELLEDRLGLAARVHEDKRHRVSFDQVVDFIERVPRRMAGPRKLSRCVEHRDVGCGTRLGEHEIGKRRAAALRHEITAQVVRLGDGRREADGRKLRRNGE